jgi:hypothetical protein
MILFVVLLILPPERRALRDEDDVLSCLRVMLIRKALFRKENEESLSVE